MKAHLTQPLKRAARVKRNNIATIDGARRRTWGELLGRVARAAGGMRRLGLEAGERVAVMAMSGDRYFELHFAIPWAGGAIVPINTRLSASEIDFILRDSGATMIFVDETQRPVVEALGETMAGFKAVISLDDQVSDDWIAYDGLATGEEPMEDVLRGGADMAGIFYTGGSSGRPKGVMLSHDNLSTNAMNAVWGIGYDSDSIYLHAAPMFHLTDGMSTFSLSMVAGTHVFIPRFDARACLQAIEHNRVTHICLVPTMIEMLVNLAEKERFDLSSLKQFQFGAAPMPEATLERALKLWPDMLFLHGWGMTEISPLGLMLPKEWRDPRVAGPKLRSCGMPMLNEEAAIIDPDTGRELAPGEVGELVIRGPMVMQGYWNMPEETEKALAGGWLHTGDAAYVDADGFFYIVDRIKDMIISGGENVYSLEVENVIGKYPGVAQVAVVGIPHELWGETVHASILPEPGTELDTEAIAAYVKSKIAGYKCPRSWEIRADPLPVTGAGKVFKKGVKEEFLARRNAGGIA